MKRQFKVFRVDASKLRSNNDSYDTLLAMDFNEGYISWILILSEDGYLQASFSFFPRKVGNYKVYLSMARIIAAESIEGYAAIRRENRKYEISQR